MRITSKQAYDEIKATGRLSDLQMAVLHYVALHPDCTALECERHYKPHNYSSIAARFKPLVDQGFIEVTGTRPQEGSDRLTYRMTGKTNGIDRLSKKRNELAAVETRLSKLYARAGAIRLEIARLQNTNQLEML